MKKSRKKHSTICALTCDPNLLWFVREQAKIHSCAVLVLDTLADLEKQILSKKSEPNIIFLDFDILHRNDDATAAVCKLKAVHSDLMLAVITSKAELADVLQRNQIEHIFLRPYLFEKLEEVVSEFFKRIQKEKYHEKPKQFKSNEMLYAKILVVDDEIEVCEFIRDFLEESEDGDFDVRFAHEPEEAIRLCREFEPDLAIVDLKLPQISGLELIERFRRLSGFKPKEYLIFTGSDSPEDLDRIEEKGLLHLSKSSGVEQMLRTINSICRKWSLARKRAS